MSEPTDKSSPMATIGSVAGAIGGWSLSQYCGASILIPGAAILLFLLLFSKGPVRPKYFLGAISTTAAHVTWFAVASALTGLWSQMALDIILLTVGILFLWTRPSLSSVVFLGLIQTASLVLNIYTISSVTFGSAPHRALTAHCIFRLLAIICLVSGYVRLRRQPPPPLPDSATALS